MHDFFFVPWKVNKTMFFKWRTYCMRISSFFKGTCSRSPVESPAGTEVFVNDRTRQTLAKLTETHGTTFPCLSPPNALFRSYFLRVRCNFTLLRATDNHSRPPHFYFTRNVLYKVDRTLLHYQHMNTAKSANIHGHTNAPPAPRHKRAPSCLRPDFYSAYVLYAATTPTPPSIDKSSQPIRPPDGVIPNKHQHSGRHICAVKPLHRKSGKYSCGQRLVVRPDRAAGLCEALLPPQLNPTASCVQRRPGVVASLHA